MKYSESSEEENEMNRYIPEKMVKISRYRKYFPNLGKNIQYDIYTSYVPDKSEFAKTIKTRKDSVILYCQIKKCLIKD